MNNDQEWRDRLFKEIDHIREDVKFLRDGMSHLKIKVGLISMFITSIVSVIINKFL